METQIKKRIIRVKRKRKPKDMTLKEEYIFQMNDKERAVYEIAKEHLGSSFNLEKSIGFQKFIEKKN